MAASPLPAAGVLGAVPAVAAGAPALPVIPVIIAGAVSIAALILVWKLIESIQSEGATEEGIEFKVDKYANVEVKKTKTPSKMHFTTNKEHTIASAPTSDLKDPEVARTFKTCMAAALIAMLVSNGIAFEEAQRMIHQTMSAADNTQSKIETLDINSSLVENIGSAAGSTPNSK